MIYNLNESKKNEYNSELIKYISFKHHYNGERLIYSKKYSHGTFSITNPTLEYKGCELINGYPHFLIPLDVCLIEINNFINGNPLYQENFSIRYGDTHPHKPIPKLSQIRNLFMEDILINMIITSGIKRGIYTIGNISVKSIRDFLIINNVDDLEINTERLFQDIVNGNLDNNVFHMLFDNYSIAAELKIKDFLNKIGMDQREFLHESDLYMNSELYNYLKNASCYQRELKHNGELKYSLQELMFILTTTKGSDHLINIIGNNQSDHVRRVIKLLNSENSDLNVSFLTYGICKNGESRDIEEWYKYLEEFIVKNGVTINGNYISPYDLLKIITISLSNDDIIDYNSLEKYRRNYIMFKEIYDSLRENRVTSIGDHLEEPNDLISMMSLVNYKLNRSIESGEQSSFFKYIYCIVREYNTQPEKYVNMRHIYCEFLQVALTRMSLQNIGINNNINRKKLEK